MGFVSSVQVNLHPINMIKSAIFTALIGTLLYEPANSASINYEPIQITVNENFNTQPDQLSRRMQSRDREFILQNTNINLEPQLSLPTGSILSDIETLLSFIRPEPFKNVFSKLAVEKSYKVPASVTVEEKVETLPQQVPVVINDLSKPLASVLQVMPEAPVLPYISLHDLSPTVIDKVEINSNTVGLTPGKSVIVSAALPEITAIPTMEEDNMVTKPIRRTMLNEKTSYVIEEEPKVWVESEPTYPTIPSYSHSHPGTSANPKQVKIITEGENEPTYPTILPYSNQLISVNSTEEKVKPEPTYPTVLFYARSIPEISAKPMEEKVLTEAEPEPTYPTIPLYSHSNPGKSAAQDAGITNAKLNPVYLEFPTATQDLKEWLSFHVEKDSTEDLPKQETDFMDSTMKPTNTEFPIIPQAPSLPALSLTDLPPFIEDEDKSKKFIDFYVTNPESFTGPIQKTTETIDADPKPMNIELPVIPKAPELPPLTLNTLPSTIEEEFKSKNSINLLPAFPQFSAMVTQENIAIDSESIPINKELPIIPEAPVLPPLSLTEVPSTVGEVVESKESINVFPAISQMSATPTQEKTAINFEPIPVNKEVSAIPEAPVLPPLRLANLPSAVEEKVKSEESINLFPTRPQTSATPTQEKIPIDADLIPINTESPIIPIAPVLPPITLKRIPSIIDDKITPEESIKVFPAVPQMSATPTQENIANDSEQIPINKELPVIPEAPLLPPLKLDDMPTTAEEEIKSEESINVFPAIPQESATPTQEKIAIDSEPISINKKLPVIPEAPVLPPLTSANLPSTVTEEVKSEESINVFPAIPQISATPTQEKITVDSEPIPVNKELPAIPDAPVLPPLRLANLPSAVEEEVKSEESYNVFPANPHMSATPTQENIAIDSEPIPINNELPVIPDAPVLPPLTLATLPSTVVEEVKSEESTNVFPAIPQISATPTQEKITVDSEPIPVNKELPDIPEAPVLPPLRLTNLPSAVEEEIKSVESYNVFPAIPQMSATPTQENIGIDSEPIPINKELPVIPDAPVLPPLTLANLPSTVAEEVKSEESINVFPAFSQMSATPTQEKTAINSKPIPFNKELPIIPEAPVLSPLRLTNLPSAVEEEIKSEESYNVFPAIPQMSATPTQEKIAFDSEPIPINKELPVIPDAPVLPPLKLATLPSTVAEEVKSEETINVFPAFSQMSATPTQEKTAINSESIPVNKEVPAIPEAPVLPPLRLSNLPSTVEEEVKSEESINVFPAIPQMSATPTQEKIALYTEPISINKELPAIPEAPVLPPLMLTELPSTVKEVAKSAESINMFPTISQTSATPAQEKITIDAVPIAINTELPVIPEAPIISPLTLKKLHSNIDDDFALERWINVFPAVPQIYATPTQEKLAVNAEYKPACTKLPVIPEAPTLPPLLLNKLAPLLGEGESDELSFRQILSNYNKRN